MDNVVIVGNRLYIYLLSSLEILRSSPILQLYSCNSSFGVVVKGFAGFTGVHRAKNPCCFTLPLTSGFTLPSNLNDCEGN